MQQNGFLGPCHLTEEEQLASGGKRTVRQPPHTLLRSASKVPTEGYHGEGSGLILTTLQPSQPILQKILNIPHHVRGARSCKGRMCDNDHCGQRGKGT